MGARSHTPPPQRVRPRRDALTHTGRLQPAFSAPGRTPQQALEAHGRIARTRGPVLGAGPVVKGDGVVRGVCAPPDDARVGRAGAAVPGARAARLPARLPHPHRTHGGHITPRTPQPMQRRVSTGGGSVCLGQGRGRAGLVFGCVPWRLTPLRARHMCVRVRTCACLRGCVLVWVRVGVNACGRVCPPPQRPHRSRSRSASSWPGN